MMEKLSFIKSISCIRNAPFGRGFLKSLYICNIKILYTYQVYLIFLSAYLCRIVFATETVIIIDTVICDSNKT